MTNSIDAEKKAALETRIRSLETTVAELEIELSALVSRLECIVMSLKLQLTATSSPDAKTTVDNHINLLHQYNEIRDIGMMLLSQVADNERIRQADVMERFGMTKDD
ncbi:Mating-type switching protein swi5 [Neolecta irregularis DAH-3]|uniref:Mating-type switching protein swi5 n=1 Tax=Neolecta irregularis (strain DAH-3) TaxID=1198029 RepID=A0A1U7LHW7_NEOID|nr:Mating-type switching protein swi5 [Neolecta irregularis DAH-3]|eukprot:OLL22239.1 Mating-type switching protein swi5 [Neolecta irregularis DAH-3]